MLDMFSPDQKASILASVMTQEAAGTTTRDACRAQGITLQTYLDWKADARKRHDSTLTLTNGSRFRAKNKVRREAQKTAMQLALEAAQQKTEAQAENGHDIEVQPPHHYTVPVQTPDEFKARALMLPQRPLLDGLPEDNPEDLAALAEPHIYTPPPVIEKPSLPASLAARQLPLYAPAVAPAVPVAPPVQASADESMQDSPETRNGAENGPIEEKESIVPKNPNRAQGVQAALVAAMPWLPALDAKTEKKLGIKKPAKGTPGYTTFLKTRRALMTPEQGEQLAAFYAPGKQQATVAAKSAAAKAATAAKKAANGAHEPKAAAPAKRAPYKTKRRMAEQAGIIESQIKAAGQMAPRPLAATPAMQELLVEHADVTAQLELATTAPQDAAPNGYTQGVKIDAGGHLVDSQPGREAMLLAEIEKLKRALTAITLENLKLRGLL